MFLTNKSQHITGNIKIQNLLFKNVNTSLALKTVFFLPEAALESPSGLPCCTMLKL